jgi:uncharacterized protein
VKSKRLLRTYMWRAVGKDSLERGQLWQDEQHWIMNGTILRLSDSDPAEVRYEIICDARWCTGIANISCQNDQGKRELRLSRNDDGWYANETRLQLPRDCTDVDLAWSPSTNTLPIRRLQLNVGGISGPLTAAWVRLPELRVEALQQTYERTGPHSYIYRSGGGSFKANLTVDEDDLIVDYEGVWGRIGQKTSST